jgi:hypothetical protein
MKDLLHYKNIFFLYLTNALAFHVSTDKVYYGNRASQHKFQKQHYDYSEYTNFQEDKVMVIQQLNLVWRKCYYQEVRLVQS